AQAIAQSALRALPERLALFPCPDPLFSLQRTFASFHSLDARAWLARGARGAAARSAFSHQSSPGCAQGFYDARADERISELSLPLGRETCLRTNRHVRKPAW